MQISELDLHNLSECFRKVLEILFTKITSIGIRYAYFAILWSVMVFVTIFSKTIGNQGNPMGTMYELSSAAVEEYFEILLTWRCRKNFSTELFSKISDSMERYESKLFISDI